MKNKKKSGLTLLGFVMLATGILSFFLSAMGLDLAFLEWVNELGAMVGLFIRLFLILGGFVVMYMSVTDFDKEDI